MFRYAWAYQGSQLGMSNAYIAYPIQTITMRLNRTRPKTRVHPNEPRVTINRRMPVAQTTPGQVYIFSKR